MSVSVCFTDDASLHWCRNKVYISHTLSFTLHLQPGRNAPSATHTHNKADVKVASISLCREGAQAHSPPYRRLHHTCLHTTLHTQHTTQAPCKGLGQCSPIGSSDLRKGSLKDLETISHCTVYVLYPLNCQGAFLPALLALHQFSLWCACEERSIMGKAYEGMPHWGCKGTVPL